MLRIRPIGFLAVAFIILVMAAMAGRATADTATVGVSATVLAGSCRFNSGGTVSFTLDHATGGNVSATITQPVYRCSKDASFVISDDNGLHESGTTHRMKHTTLNEYIPYSFTYTASGTGLGNGKPVTMDIASMVAEADYMDVPAGSYSDTVTLTINP